LLLLLSGDEFIFFDLKGRKILPAGFPGALFRIALTYPNLTLAAGVLSPAKRFNGYTQLLRCRQDGLTAPHFPAPAGRLKDNFDFSLVQETGPSSPIPPKGVKKLIQLSFMSFRRKPESSVFKSLRIAWTPVFTGVTT
jgi:hypothetical protein